MLADQGHAARPHAGAARGAAAGPPPVERQGMGSPSPARDGAA